jgi:hypothetical protein
MRSGDGSTSLTTGCINNYLGCRRIFDVDARRARPHPWTQACPNNVDPESRRHQREPPA